MPSRITGRDYPGILADTTDFARAVMPELVADTSNANPGTVLMQVIALVGDQANYAIDSAVSDVLPATSQQLATVSPFLQTIGYRRRGPSAATVTVSSTSTLPAGLGSGVISAGQAITTKNGLRFEVVDDSPFPSGISSITVQLTEGTSVTEVFSATGSSNQTITLSGLNVSEGSWKVYVGTAGSSAALWTEVPSVLTQEISGPYYETSYNSSGSLIIRFGDGVSGAVPSQDITVTYRTCSGASGMIAAGILQGTLIAVPDSGSPSSVNVQFLNQEIVDVTTTRTIAVVGEVVALASGSTTTTATLSSTPIIRGQVSLVFSDSSHACVLRDDGNGKFISPSNTFTGFTFTSGTIDYGSGNISITLSAAFPTAISVADYSYTQAASLSTIAGAAQGGADAEQLSDLRINVPSYMRGRGLLLSPADYGALKGRVAGVSLAYADPWTTPDGLQIAVYAWTSGTGQATVSNNSRTLTIYRPTLQYEQIDSTVFPAIQAYIREHAFLGPLHAIKAPKMWWASIYLGTVSGSATYDATSLRASIADAIISYLESATGFVIGLGSLYDAIRSVPGVKSFNVERITLGKTAPSLTEAVATTVASVTQTGVLQYTIVSPQTLTITLAQSGGTIVLQDTGARYIVMGTPVPDCGTLVLVSGAATLTVGYINYRTGAFSATFASSLSSGYQITANYQDVYYDYRKTQTDTLGTGSAWPPPGYGVIPSLDGKPIADITTPGAPPYVNGDLLLYDALKDIDVTPEALAARYYDGSYLYNGTITYSNAAATADPRSINLNRVDFDLVLS